MYGSGCWLAGVKFQEGEGQQRARFAEDLQLLEKALDRVGVPAFLALTPEAVEPHDCRHALLGVANRLPISLAGGLSLGKGVCQHKVAAAAP